MAAAPPPPRSHRDGGDAPVSLFLDTDLGTHLALLVAPDTTFRALKPQVDAEHAAAFPEHGPVAAKSFQVRWRGVLYHLSDSMTVISAFSKIKGGCLLHVKMTEAAAATRCCQDDGRRSNDGRLGIHVQKRLQELPAMASEIACDVLPQRLEGGAVAAPLNYVQVHDVLPSSNTEMKNEAVGLASDTEEEYNPVIEKAKSYGNQIKHANQTEGAYISSTSIANVGIPSNQRNMSHAVEEVHASKEDILHGDGDQDVGGDVSDDKQVRKQEQMLKGKHATDNLQQEKEHKKSRTNSFDTSAADPPRITNEPDATDLTKSSRAPLEAGTNSHREPLDTSFGQEVQVTIHDESTGNPSTVGKNSKKKKKKKRQETSEPSAGANELSKSTGDAYNVELAGRDEPADKASGLPLSSSGKDGNQGDKHVQFLSDAQASIDLISEQGKFDDALKGCRNPSIGEAISSAGEVVASEEKISKGIITPSDGGEEHEQINKHNEESHDEGVAEMNNIKKDGKTADALEKRWTNDNTSQLKKRKKAKKGCSADLASMDTTHDKEMHEYSENAARSDTVFTDKEIVHDPSTQRISNVVHQADSNILENLSGDGKKKKRRRHRSEFSEGVGPSQDLTRPSEFVMNESSMHVADGAPLDAKQTTARAIDGATVLDHKKLGENPDIVATTLIDEVLSDLRSKDYFDKDSGGDMLAGKIHLGNNENAELPETTGDKVGVGAALPVKYPAGVHSDAFASSPSHKKSKGKRLKVTSTMIDSSHHSSAVPKEDANRELNESDSLRFSDKTSDPKDILTGDAVAQADEKPKATKRRKKKVSLQQELADNGKTLDEQVSQVDTVDMKGVNSTQANLVRGGSVVDTPVSTAGKVEQKGGRSSPTQTARIQETSSTPGLDDQLAKDSQGEYRTGVIGGHNNENAAGTPTKTPVVQKDEALKSSNPNAQKARKKSLNLNVQSRDSALEHASGAYLGNHRSERGLVSPKSSAGAAEPNYDVAVHPASDAINFHEHFSSTKVDDPSVFTEHKQNNEDETLREVKNKKKNKRKQGTVSSEPNVVLESRHPADRSGLTANFGTSKATVPSVAVENMNREDENVKIGKEKKRKRKSNMEFSVAEKENPNSGNQGYIATQESHLSVAQKGKMGLDKGKESSSKVNQSDIMVPYKPEDSTLEKKLHKNGVDGQNKLLTGKDHVHISKDVRKSTSQIKPHAKSKHDESVKGRVAPNPKPVSNLVKDFSMSPQVSSDSTEGTPQNANRYRVAVRKVPSKRYEQISEKSKKGNRKVSPGAIFNDANSEGSDDELDTKNDEVAMGASPSNLSTSADSGISSAANDESDVHDDDDEGTISLSQKSLNHGLHIGSILRGSSSFKKARQKRSELSDDDTEVPDSQPVDGL